MKTTEKNALARVLCISREAYRAVCDGAEGLNFVALLDGLSAVLSHYKDEKQPISKLLRALKRDIKDKNKLFYPTAAKYFSKLYPIMDYDYSRALPHIEAIIYGNDKICEKLVKNEADKAKSMADAMRSYPGYLFGEFSALSGEQFYDLVFGYYPKLYEEEFMGEMKNLF